MDSVFESNPVLVEFDPVLQIPQVEMDAFASQFALAALHDVMPFDLPLEHLNDNIVSDGDDIFLPACSLPANGYELGPEFRRVEDAVSINVNMTADTFITAFDPQEDNQVQVNDLFSQYILPDAANPVQENVAQLVPNKVTSSEQGEEVVEPALQLESPYLLSYNLPLFDREEQVGLPSANPPVISKNTISEYGTSSPENYALGHLGDNSMNLHDSRRPLLQQSASLKRGLSYTTYTTSTRAPTPPVKKMRKETPPPFSHFIEGEDALNISAEHHAKRPLPHMDMNSEVSYMTASTIDTCASSEKPAARFVKRRILHAIKYQCTLCPKSYKRRYDCAVHVEEKHLGISTFQCSDCGYTSPRKFSFNRHKKTCKAGTKNSHSNKASPFLEHTPRNKSLASIF